MNLDDLARQHDQFFEQLQSVLQRGPYDDLADHSAELLKNRAEDISRRIEGLKAAREQHAIRIDAQIEELRNQAAELEKTLRRGTPLNPSSSTRTRRKAATARPPASGRRGKRRSK